MPTSFDEQYTAKQARWFPNEELVRFLGRNYGSPYPYVNRNLTVGDIGCGTGANLKALFAWGFLCTGCDASMQAVMLARAWAGVGTCDLAVVPPLPWKDASLDLVVDVQTIQHLSDEEHVKMYAEVLRVLRPGGKFFSQHVLFARPGVYPSHPELREWAARALAATMRQVGLDAKVTDITKRASLTFLDDVIWGSFEAVKP
jgi:SAM-dependent methyltransferase